MEACNKTDTNAIVINNFYSDAVIPWLKSAKKIILTLKWKFKSFNSKNEICRC